MSYLKNENDFIECKNFIYTFCNINLKSRLWNKEKFNSRIKNDSDFLDEIVDLNIMLNDLFLKIDFLDKEHSRLLKYYHSLFGSIQEELINKLFPKENRENWLKKYLIYPKNPNLFKNGKPIYLNT